MNSYEVCSRLLSAESEREVNTIIESVQEMSEASNWYPLDDRENNVNTVGNQSSVASKALTELITNASDAVIMKAANLEGINPSSPDCPQSPQEAVRLLFRNQLPGSERAGRLNDIDSDADLREFARNNLVVGITGERDFGETCFTFVDNGEGQKPEDFNRTFLSFSHNNKASIPYEEILKLDFGRLRG